MPLPTAPAGGPASADPTGPVRQAGLITLPLGLLLVARPHLAARLLGLADHDHGLRVIGAADLALVPGLLSGRRPARWMSSRAGLNVVIAGYCADLVRRERRIGAGLGAAAMVVATAADVRTLRALRRAG